MYQTINFTRFVDAFSDHERQDQFSYNALEALHDYYMELEDDSGIAIELDVIAICCDWSEYDTAIKAALDYSDETFEDETDALEFLEGETTVLTFSTGILIMAY